jgi:hypothetical protein
VIHLVYHQQLQLLGGARSESGCGVQCSGWRVCAAADVLVSRFFMQSAKLLAAGQVYASGGPLLCTGRAAVQKASRGR